MKKIIIVFVLVFFIILGIFVFDKKTKIEKNIEEEVILQDENIKNNYEKNIVVEDDELEDLCNAKPTQLEIGRDEFPIDEKYSNLNFLGQVFTAYDCGEERVNEIYGVEDNIYKLGSRILLKEYPSDELIKIFDELNFECNEESIDVTGKNCKGWILYDDIGVDEIIKLNKFYTNFKLDDCIHCG